MIGFENEPVTPRTIVKSQIDSANYPYDFTGRSVVMTGGTGVLGRAIVQGLLDAGASVALVVRNRSKAESVLAEMSRPDSGIIVEGDVLKRDDLQRALEEVIKAFGRVDCLVNAAGGNDPRATTRPDLSFFDLPEDALRFVFDLNLLGTIVPTQVFGKQMI